MSQTASLRPPLDPHYVTGFVEGAGRFTYSRSGRSLALYFAIKLSTDDDRLLESVRAFFGGIGSIYVISSSRGEDRRETRYFRVTRLDHLERIIRHFDRYPLLGPKVEAYQVWREMFELKSSLPRRPADASLDRLAKTLSGRLSRKAPGS